MYSPPGGNPPKHIDYDDYIRDLEKALAKHNLPIAGLTQTFLDDHYQKQTPPLLVVKEILSTPAGKAKQRSVKTDIRLAVVASVVMIALFLLIFKDQFDTKINNSIDTRERVGRASPKNSFEKELGSLGLDITKKYYSWPLVEAGDMVDSDGVIRGTITNYGNRAIRYARVKFRYYDPKDNLIGTGSDYVSELLPGESWEYEVRYRGYADRIDSYRGPFVEGSGVTGDPREL